MYFDEIRLQSNHRKTLICNKNKSHTATTGADAGLTFNNSRDRCSLLADTRYSRLQVGEVQIIVYCRGTGTAMPRSAYLIFLKYAVFFIQSTVNSQQSTLNYKLVSNRAFRRINVNKVSFWEIISAVTSIPG